MILACLGDSLSCGYMLGLSFVEDPKGTFPVIVAQTFGATQISVVAIAGAEIDAIGTHITELPAAADVLIINVGTNDLWPVAEAQRPENLAGVIVRWNAFYAAARAHMPHARVVIVGLRDYTVQESRGASDVPLREATARFNAHVLSRPDTLPVDLWAREGGYTVRTFPDGVHPSPYGAHWIADAVIAALAAEFPMK
jgi:lysophospholipase L1-like esterase